MTTLPIPLEALEAAHWLIAGTTGSGKTYLARGLLEQLRRAGRRVGAVDKLSKLWGLTISADGTGPGLEFVIFGGKRPGAVPMRPLDGGKIGRLFVERNIPAIFDLGQWDADDQELWVEEFARAVFLANEAALHLMLDEVQAWAPANGGGPAYKAVRLLAEQGRGNGINLLMTAPRLNGVDVGVRQALGGMVAMRQTSARDRAAVAELVGGHLEVDEKALRGELAGLPTGTGLVWSPTGAALERVAFGENATFDSSRTPRHGDAPPPPIAISSALVEELRAALAPPAAKPADDAQRVIDEADAALADVLPDRDRRIAELELQVAELQAEIAEREAECEGYSRMCDYARMVLDAALNGETVPVPPVHADKWPLPDAQAPGERSSRSGGKGAADETPPLSSAAKGVAAFAANTKARRSADIIFSEPAADAPELLNEAAREFAQILKVDSTVSWTWNELALVTVRRPGSGYLGKARKALLDRGWVEEAAGEIHASDALCIEPGIEGALPADPRDLITLWAEVLRGPGGDILRELAANGPGTREQLGRRIAKAHTSGWFGKGMKDLTRSNLVEVNGGIVALAPLLRSGR